MPTLGGINIPRYHSAVGSAPLRDYGLVEFASDDPVTLKTLNEAIIECATSPNEDNALALRYDNQQMLLKLMSKLQRTIEKRNAHNVQCRISYDTDQLENEDASIESHNDGWISLSELFGEVGGRSVSDYILYRLFTTYLQPIVLPSGKAVGYEFLLRPLPEQSPFRPAELFEEARRIGQHSYLDRAARHSAIQMGASHLPSGMKRFVNFLPSSLHQPKTCLKSTFETIRQSGTDPRDYVFEVMETEPLDDPRLQNVFEVYRQEGVHLALDDVGSGFATLDIVDELRPDYVKMDRRWVSSCEGDPQKQRYIDRLLERVSRFHGVVLAEGVERQEEWDYLKNAGVPLFQGYLFGRATPIPTEIPVEAR
ncbi:EAL domain-containing protein [Cohnella mopanensis]|uniref:EAL domain-containing protein n=1 Tax=Cohnella mopanensis TaxID=2911966 RepID=UPI001EF8F68F|nr:EAL domain-containing protein [Cohnella mopanensis]